MNNHTKGPWKTEKNGVHSWHIAAINSPVNNDWIEVWSPSANCGDEETMEANARLIAAAPELLEALAELADYVDERTGDNECRTLENARAAIAKARGSDE